MLPFSKRVVNASFALGLFSKVWKAVSDALSLWPFAGPKPKVSTLASVSMAWALVMDAMTVSNSAGFLSPRFCILVSSVNQFTLLSVMVSAQKMPLRTEYTSFRFWRNSRYFSPFVLGKMNWALHILGSSYPVTLICSGGSPLMIEVTFKVTTWSIR